MDNPLIPARAPTRNRSRRASESEYDQEYPARERDEYDQPAVPAGPDAGKQYTT